MNFLSNLNQILDQGKKNAESWILISLILELKRQDQSKNPLSQKIILP
jgi:hypothetical protein